MISAKKIKCNINEALFILHKSNSKLQQLNE
jgi:hypothetical protein